jgi:hypothetical protein
VRRRPYATVSCKLSLIANKYRATTDTGPGYPETPASGDSRFVYNVGGIQSITTSQAQADSGMFEASLRDERLLPFEGCGAVSTWIVELPTAWKGFDHSTITDLVLHIRYTALDGGAGCRATVEGGLRDMLNTMALATTRSGLFRAFDLSFEFPDAWYRFQRDKQVTLTLPRTLLPIYATDHAPATEALMLMAVGTGAPASIALTIDGADMTVSQDSAFANTVATRTADPSPINLDTSFVLASPVADKLERLVMLVKYQVS